eukprot:jgi/Psemu1/322120/estExt_fgenesh1_pg.C_190074
MKASPSHRSSFVGVAFCLLCQYPSFTVSQEQDDDDVVVQPIMLNAIEDYKSSLSDAIPTLSALTNRMQVDDISDNDKFGFGNFSATNETVNLTIGFDFDDDDRSWNFEDVLSNDNATTESNVDNVTLSIDSDASNDNNDGADYTADDLSPVESVEKDRENDNGADYNTAEDLSPVEAVEKDRENDDSADYNTAEDLSSLEPVEKDRKNDVYPTPSPSVTENVEGNALSQGAIIGITIGGSVLLIGMGLLYFICILKKSKNDGNYDEMDKGDIPKSPSPRKKSPWRPNGKAKSDPDDTGDSIAERSLLRSENSNDQDKNLRNDIESSDLASTDDVESHAMYSYNQSYGDSGSIYTHASSIRVHSNPSYAYGNDNTSYAYSLEPGIEASVVGVESMSSHGDDSRSMPIREISRVNVEGGDAPGTQPGSTADTEQKKENFKFDHFGITQIATIPSELKLTKSELAMLPSNLRNSDDDERDIDIRDAFQGDNGKKTVTRKVLAPAGRLGVVIDTTVRGPVVHKVNQESKLVGKIFPGDVIIAIDDVDTRAMSANDINAVMVRTANQNRILTIIGAP